MRTCTDTIPSRYPYQVGTKVDRVGTRTVILRRTEYQVGIRTKLVLGRIELVRVSSRTKLVARRTELVRVTTKLAPMRTELVRVPRRYPYRTTCTKVDRVGTRTKLVPRQTVGPGTKLV